MLPTLNRRSVLLTTVAALNSAAANGEGVPASEQDDQRAWQTFKNRFLTPEGRVVDTGNHGVSHTEGQGWGLLFAQAWNDEATFNRILTWTDHTLRRSSDALHAWRYVPDGPVLVPDSNNATDGDLFIAWSLARASERWHRPALRDQAVAIARSILSLLTVTVAGRTLLLPGVDGFRKEDGVVVNPSYYAFAALEALAILVPDPRWIALHRGGLDLLARAQFGRWALPCDWVWAGMDGAIRPAAGFPPRYGFDAVRVPLHLAWAGLQSPARTATAAWWREAQASGPGPAWVDVTSGEIAPYSASAGMAAARDLGADAPVRPPPAVTDDMDYYAAALSLLVRVAVRDVSAGRTGAGQH